MNATLNLQSIRQARIAFGAEGGKPSLSERFAAVAKIAAAHADAVDREARFPAETFAAVKAEGLLGLLVPQKFGGPEAPLAEIVDGCAMLGRACASSGMIFAMHHCALACLVRHAGDDPWRNDLLRDIARNQLLIASSTTEGVNGGNVRVSEAPILTADGRISLDRDASCISYGEQADIIISTARRSPEAAPSDQVLVAFRCEQATLTRTQNWDSLGMRGTCSVGFKLHGEGSPAQVYPDAYERISARTMVPTTHLLWAAVWSGVASGAVGRAREFVRHAARAAGGALPPAAARLSEARLSLQTLRSLVMAALQQCERDQLSGADAKLDLGLLKIEASELAVRTVMIAMRTTGLPGYRNDTPFSMSRYLRDILSTPIMINNDRILGNLGPAIMMAEVPTAFR